MSNPGGTSTSQRSPVTEDILENSSKMATYRLPRFSSRRQSSVSSVGDHAHLLRAESSVEGPHQLTQAHLESADALLGGDVSKMHAAVSSVIENALGHEIPGVEVRFRNLELSTLVPQGKNGSGEVPTLATHVQQGLRNLFFKSKQQFVEKKILKGVTGVFKPGRITLVLGQPGSGKSSLMNVLSNRFHMGPNITLGGDITYNGSAQADLLEALPRYVTYANQIDDHYPRLTVQETFEFAHRCCTGKELAPAAVEALKNCSPEHHEHALNVLTAHHKFAPELTVKMLGLDKCKDTIVGNAMLRGVSGGERKRVTTGEMLFGMKRLQLLDEISTGLDSAATYDICKAMKSAARNFNATVVISLLQPSPEVFELFDDVLLLNDGTIMFHGNREDAVPYFEQMGFHCPPRKDVADFLLDLGTNKQDAYVVGGDKGVPYHAAEFAAIFRASSIFQSTLKYLDAPFTGKSIITDFQPFRQSFTEDLVTLLQRQVKLRIRDRAYLMGRAIMVIVMGLLYGSTFWQMDSTDSQLMLGLLFSCTMFLSMSQASQVPTFMEARSVFYKQRGANFFRSAAYVLATSITQVPLGIMETVVFGTIVYWCGGYVSLADRFIVFLVTLFLCQMWFTSFIFFLSSGLPNLTIAQPVMNVCVLFFVLFGGFLITRGNIPAYMQWLYWVDPIAYCIRALGINQFLAPEFDVCVRDGTDYCAKYNETVGEYSLGVFDLQTESMWIWYGWIYFIAGYFLFVFGAYFLLEYKRFESPEGVDSADDSDGEENHGAYSAMPATPKEAEKVIEILDGEDGTPTMKLPVDSTGRGVSVPVTLAFQDLWYSVPMPGGKKDEEIDLLKGVPGFALPGTMTALMGSSGAGKTTLMDVIAVAEASAVRSCSTVTRPTI